MDKRSKYFMISGLVVICLLFIVAAVHYNVAAEKGQDTFAGQGVTLAQLGLEGSDLEAAVAAAETQEAAVEEPAAAEAPEAETDEGIIMMEAEGYEKHDKGIVPFTHIKHIEAYELGCGECHHNQDGEPLDGLTLEDDVQGCIICHSTPGRAPKGTSGEEELQFHAEALHQNCITCHKESGSKEAPTSCGKCHPRK